ARDTLVEKFAAQAARDEIEVGPSRAGTSAKRPWQPTRDLTEPLATARRPASEAVSRAMGKLLELGEQLGADRHRELGGGGRRWRAKVGGMVDQGRIGLMSDRRDQRNWRFGDRADDLLLV